MASFGLKRGEAGSLSALLRHLSPARRRQILFTAALMAMGGITEMASLGAVIAFLAILSGAQSGSGARILELLDLMNFPMGPDALPAAVVLLVAMGALAATARIALAWATNKVVLRVGHELAVTVYSRMLRQPYSRYVRRNTSEVLAGMEKVQVLVFAVLNPALQASAAVVVSLFIVAALVALDPITATIAAISIAIPYLIVTIVTRRLLRRNSQTVAGKHTERVQQVQEGLGGFRDIVIDQSQQVFEEDFRRLDLAYRRAYAVNVFVTAAPRFIVEFAGIVVIAAMAVIMSRQNGGIVAAIPVLGAMALGAQRLLPLVQQIYYGWSSMNGSRQIIDDVLVLLDSPVETIVQRDRNSPVVSLEQGVSLERVGFRYEGTGIDVLRDIDLFIPRGSTTGFLGSTGSGKSTLFDLVMALLRPTSGRILVDGVPLDDRTISAWHAQISHVPQAIYLADRTIAENIAFGEPLEVIDMDRVAAAAQRAQIAAFIEQLPMAYLTLTGERGLRLSGGQRQRLGIARALYKKANVLILDEATSALDNDTERAVIESLGHGGDNLTVLMIAHRLTTLAGCDQVVRLEKGRIVEIGSYDDIVGGSIA